MRDIKSEHAIADEIVVDTVPLSYQPILTDLTKVAEWSIATNVDWLGREYWLAAMALRLSAKLWPFERFSWLSVLQCGYAGLWRDTLLKKVSAQWDSTVDELKNVVGKKTFAGSPLEFVTALSQSPVSMRPMRMGPIIRVDGDLALFDLVAAMQSLDVAIDYPTADEEIANERSGQFEIVVQEMIDRSPWSPPPGLRIMRGRTLRLNGKSLTDLDAIARDTPPHAPSTAV